MRITQCLPCTKKKWKPCRTNTTTLQVFDSTTKVINQFVTNGRSHRYYLDASSFNIRGVRRVFHYLTF